MLTRHIALVRQSARISDKEFLTAAAALQVQLTRDLSHSWSVQATIVPCLDPHAIPAGHWPIRIMDEIPQPGAEGYHTDLHHQPFALVRWSPSWTITASHEMLEMLVDPFGDHLFTAKAPDIAPDGDVNYLVEICDPCESDLCAYPIQGIAVSDFYTPDFFDARQHTAKRYSIAGNIHHPRQILKGGYLSWMNSVTGQWFQATWFNLKPEIHMIPGRHAARNEPHRVRCAKFKRDLKHNTHHDDVATI